MGRRKKVPDPQTQEIDDKVKNFASHFIGERFNQMDKETAIKLQNALHELEKTLSKKEEDTYRTSSRFYEGFQVDKEGHLLTFKKFRGGRVAGGGTIQEKAFKQISIILDILRDADELTVAFYNRTVTPDGKISLEVKTGSEKDVSTAIHKKVIPGYNGKKDFVSKQLGFLASSLQKEVVSEAFIAHYERYREIGVEHVEKNNLWNSYKRSFGGYITEAFEQHRHKYHKGLDYSSDDFNEDIDRQEVAIELWYAAHNNVGWWAAGDVDNIQVKLGNTNLASFASIRNVTNELIAMYNNPKNFTVEQFNDLFNQTKESIVDWELILDSTNEKIQSKLDKIKKDFSKTF